MLAHGLMLAGLLTAIPATGLGAGVRPSLEPARFICNAEGRCFETGDLDDRRDRDDDDRDDRRRSRHRHEDDDDE